MPEYPMKNKKQLVPLIRLLDNTIGPLMVVLLGAVLSLVSVSQAVCAPIHDAAKNKDLEAIQRIIASGEDVNAIDKQKRTALHYAAQAGDFNIVKALIDANANINARDKWGGGNTPIEYTVFDIIKWNSDCLPNCSGTDQYWFPEIFHFLREKNAVIQPDRLLLKAVRSNDPELLSYINKTWKVDIKNSDKPYVYDAVGSSAMESIRWLVKEGADVNKRGTNGNEFTPLHIAVMGNNMKLATYLLDNGAEDSLFMKDHMGKTPGDHIEGLSKDFIPMAAESSPAASSAGTRYEKCIRAVIDRHLASKTNKILQYAFGVFPKEGSFGGYTIYRSGSILYNKQKVESVAVMLFSQSIADYTSGLSWMELRTELQDSCRY